MALKSAEESQQEENQGQTQLYKGTHPVSWQFGGYTFSEATPLGRKNAVLLSWTSFFERLLARTSPLVQELQVLRASKSSRDSQTEAWAQIQALDFPQRKANLPKSTQPHDLLSPVLRFEGP